MHGWHAALSLELAPGWVRPPGEARPAGDGLDGDPRHEHSAGPEGVQRQEHGAGLDVGREERPRTVLARCRHTGPLRVQRALYLEDVCHVYVLHPPGGVVGGDSLEIEVAVAARAHGLITTPAAGKFYRSAQRQAVQRQRCQVAAGGALEWLPQEAILFDRSWSRLETRVELAGDARFAGWDIVALGRPAAGEGFVNGLCEQRFALFRDGRPLWRERNVYQGGGAQMAAAWGLGGFSVCGTLVCTVPGRHGGDGRGGHEVPGSRAGISAFDRARAGMSARGQVAALVDEIRADMEGWPAEDRYGVSWVEDVLVCRYLGRNAETVRQGLAAVWARMRPVVFRRAAVVPRIWNT